MPTCLQTYHLHFYFPFFHFVEEQGTYSLYSVTRPHPTRLVQIDQTFALSSLQYFIKYRDDENEITDISCDTDLWEAVDYFSEGSDESSATSSVVSFTSEGVP